MRNARIVLLVVGAVAALVAAGLLVAGVGVLVADGVGRDADGYFTSPEYRVQTPTRAITSEDLDLGASPADWTPREVGFRLTARAEGEQPIFVGIGEDADVAAYLEDVAHARVHRLGEPPDDVGTTVVEGGTTPAPPADQTFWAASAQGSGTQELTWDAEPGSWQLVVMNADASADVDVAARAGVDVPFLGWIGVGLLTGGLVIAATAAALLIAGAVAGGTPAPAAGGVPRPHPYPLALNGRIDPDLSRWQWLVKWILAIPHYLVLGALWIGFVVLTIVAWAAIVITGRYPRWIFDYTVGVLRWTWRVTYYATGVLATDRYPPFSLAADPSYPTDLDVTYPERLSRGLALVKWILAIPHLLIVGLLTGSTIAWSADDQGGIRIGGVVSVLVLIAGIVLLARGRYPQGLYDVVMGLQRWVYRVGAYVALMTDEYPPFRLDTGGEESGAELAPATPPPSPSPPTAPVEPGPPPTRVPT